MIRLLFVLIAVLGGVARADNATLEAARQAIQDVRYDDARRLLVEALTAGGNRPAELSEIYNLSAQAAVVLGETALAEQYYRRVLALDPEVALPADASPKLRDPFVAAQAYMAAQRRFDVRAARAGAAIEVTVVDPLGMVVAGAVSVGGERRAKVAVAAGAIALPIGASEVIDEVVVVDEHGNVLRAIGGDTLAPREPGPADATTKRPFFQRPLVYAIPAAVFGAASIAFFVDSRLAKGRYDDIVTTSPMHFYDDAESERKRWQGHTLMAGISIGVAGALAVTSIYFATRSSAAPAVTATIAPDQAQVTFGAKF